MLRFGLTPAQWKGLTDSERTDLLAYDLYVSQQLQGLMDRLYEQKANVPEVVLAHALTQLGLLS